MNTEHITIKKSQESLVLNFKIASLKDWEDYKKLRLEAISGKYQGFFGVDAQRLLEETNKTVEQWQDDLTQENMFVVLVWSGDEAIGMAKAQKREQDLWHTQGGFITEKFQNQNIGKKLFAFRILEIIKRGGKKIEMMVDSQNERSIYLNEKLGFKKTTIEPQTKTTKDNKEIKFFKMVINLTPDIITKAEKILNT